MSGYLQRVPNLIATKLYPVSLALSKYNTKYFSHPVVVTVILSCAKLIAKPLPFTVKRAVSFFVTKFFANFESTTFKCTIFQTQQQPKQDSKLQSESLIVAFVVKLTQCTS